MIRDLGPYIPKRATKLDAPILTMLLNGVHDHHRGQVFVVQVGAGNGETGLPLLPRFRDDGWSGLLIEPHPESFARLDALHANGERVAVLNLGISEVSANLPLHSLSPEGEARNRRGQHIAPHKSIHRLIPPAVCASVKGIRSRIARWAHTPHPLGPAVRP